jgi:hypothetical protein
VHINNLKVIVPTIEIRLAQFHYNNKSTNKALPGLGEFNQIIEPFQHGMIPIITSKSQSNSKLWAT